MPIIDGMPLDVGAQAVHVGHAHMLCLQELLTVATDLAIGHVRNVNPTLQTYSKHLALASERAPSPHPLLP